MRQQHREGLSKVDTWCLRVPFRTISYQAYLGSSSNFSFFAVLFEKVDDHVVIRDPFTTFANQASPLVAESQVPGECLPQEHDASVLLPHEVLGALYETDQASLSPMVVLVIN